MKRLIHDITLPVSEDIAPWPGDAGFKLNWKRRISSGDAANVSALSLSSHFGTHMDAPSHFIRDGITIDQIPPEIVMGPCAVLDLRPHLEDDLAGADVLQQAAGQLYTMAPSLPPRILMRTGYVPGRPFRTDFVSLAREAVDWLLQREVFLLGTDAPSIDPVDSTSHPAHRATLESGMVLLEGLNLDGVSPGVYHLVALPLKIVDAEGSPVRAVLTDLSTGPRGGRGDM
ncbi:MAG: cyclase family protein [Bacillota bacterium]